MAFLLGKQGVLNWNGTQVKATTKSISDDAGEVDFTNDTSGGRFEGSTDIIKTTVTFSCVVTDAASPAFAPASTGSLSWSVPGYRTITGTGFITRRGQASPTRGGYTQDIAITLTGTVTEVSS